MVIFAVGVFLLSNQAMNRAPTAVDGALRYGHRGDWGADFAFPSGSPGMGLLLLPLGIGLCIAFADVYAGWLKLLIWASLSALLVAVLNSIKMSLIPAILWQLGVYVAMIGIGGGLMFKGLKDSSSDDGQVNHPSESPGSMQVTESYRVDVPQELTDLRED